MATSLYVLLILGSLAVFASARAVVSDGLGSDGDKNGVDVDQTNGGDVQASDTNPTSAQSSRANAHRYCRGRSAGFIVCSSGLVFECNAQQELTLKENWSSHEFACPSSIL